MIGLLGDGFEDIYHIGTVRGISAEAPIPIIDITETRVFAGGVLNVKANFESLGREVECEFLTGDNLPQKHRLVTHDHTQLARWDEKDWCTWQCLDTHLDYSALVISDYGKGAITPDTIEGILPYRHIPIFVDTKSDPRVWLEAHSNITLFPNLSEYHRYEESYNWFPRVLLKQGPLGMAWMEYGQVLFTQPSFAREVVSVNGAGDTVLAAFVIATLDGLRLPASLEFASLAAAVAVGKPFTSTVTFEEIQASILT